MKKTVNDFLVTYDPKHIINIITKKKLNSNYLEIGVDQGSTFDYIENVKLKHGVDPYGVSKSITHQMTSQLFFAMNKYFFHNTYDIIFIDALHLFEYTQFEIEESLKILNPGGVIVLHDTCPREESAQLVLERDYQTMLNTVINAEEKSRLNWHENTAKYGWVGYNGNSWKVIPVYRSVSDYTIFSIPEACISIISTSKLDAFHKSRLNEYSDVNNVNWEDYEQNFEYIMNPYSYEYFIKNYK